MQIYVKHWINTGSNWNYTNIKSMPVMNDLILATERAKFTTITCFQKKGFGPGS